MTRIGILEKGDEVLSVTSEFVAVKRQNGEVDLMFVVKDELGWRIDNKNKVRIGYGEDMIEMETENGLKIISF